MVWKNTKKLGVGKAVASDGSSFVVARYFPAGNITNQGHFENNVLPPKASSWREFWSPGFGMSLWQLLGGCWLPAHLPMGYSWDIGKSYLIQTPPT